MSCEFAGHCVNPGEKKFTSVLVECPHDRIELPLFVVCGKKPGPTFFFISGEHGTELIGPETIRRFVEWLDPEKLSGTVVAVPVANPLAIRSKQHSYPYDKWVWFSGLNDMSRAWHGKGDETIAECITDFLYNEILTKSNAIASLHCTLFKPYLGFVSGHEASRQLCLDYGRISCIRAAENPGYAVKVATTQLGIPGLLIEWPPLRHVSQAAVTESVLGLKNLLISMEMLKGDIRKISDQFIIDFKQYKSEEVLAVDDGILVREKPWGSHLKKGDVIARLYDLYKYREVQCVVSPTDGLLFDTGPSPDNLATFFMHTDSVCRGQRVATVVPYHEHISNPDGDPWEHTLIGI